MSQYRTVLADPPWCERGGGKIKRGADRHYSVLKTPQIVALMQAQLDARAIAPDAHMYLWVTNNFLADGMLVMRELGFTYKTNIVWAKHRSGLGQYFRGQHELCLFGVRGSGYSVRKESRSLTTLLGKGILKRDKRHSAKPNEMYELIEERSHGPYLELFARNTRDNWDAWGDDV